MAPNTGAKCPVCDELNICDPNSLFRARKVGKGALMLCKSCGDASVISLNDMPSADGVELSQWTEKLAYDGVNNWLPCIKFTGPEAKLPSGAYIEPGFEQYPKKWLYRTASLDESPSGSTWWTFEEYASTYGFNPFLKLLAMRGLVWLKFMTKGKEVRIDTSVVVLE